jgi:hypothetical protein
MRPGWGVRHPELAGLLSSARPVASEETAWMDGSVPLRVSAYPFVVALPDELVVSVRCLVRVGESVVVCTYPDFLQVVYVGRASERDADGDQPWSDTEGYELTSCLLSLADAREVVEAASLARVFLDLLG